MRASLVSMTALASVIALGACATSGTGTSYQTELTELTEACEARGGILTPTGNQSGQPPLDYACKITGGPSGRIGG